VPYPTVLVADVQFEFITGQPGLNLDPEVVLVA
jgi:hypothetical protein